jgi:hypothetical protein
MDGNYGPRQDEFEVKYAYDVEQYKRSFGPGTKYLGPPQTVVTGPNFKKHYLQNQNLRANSIKSTVPKYPPKEPVWEGEKRPRVNGFIDFSRPREVSKSDRTVGYTPPSQPSRSITFGVAPTDERSYDKKLKEVEAEEARKQLSLKGRIAMGLSPIAPAPGHGVPGHEHGNPGFHGPVKVEQPGQNDPVDEPPIQPVVPVEEQKEEAVLNPVRRKKRTNLAVFPL